MSPSAPPSASVGVSTPPGTPAALATVTAISRSAVTSTSADSVHGSVRKACTVLKPLPHTSGRITDSPPITSPASPKRSGTHGTRRSNPCRVRSSSHRKAGPTSPASTPSRQASTRSAKLIGGTARVRYSGPAANSVCVVSSPIMAATSRAAITRRCSPPRMISATNSVPAIGAW